MEEEEMQYVDDDKYGFLRCSEESITFDLPDTDFSDILDV